MAELSFQSLVPRGLQLVPDGFARDTLAEDYDRMVSDGMLLGDAEAFDALIERCADIEARANRR